ncbi:hypothetical protein D3C77_389350 [compost metagenome]
MADVPGAHLQDRVQAYTGFTILFVVPTQIVHQLNRFVERYRLLIFWAVPCRDHLHQAVQAGDDMRRFHLFTYELLLTLFKNPVVAVVLFIDHKVEGDSVLLEIIGVVTDEEVFLQVGDLLAM